ncbi:hypothetical protein J7J08_08630 [Stenotrophomonas sp. ISL-67]|uniref:hypothetical protein n=1 Tax=Stenotrophomonas sp. ISL-67 TaxID=2819171 RepID=UPI001BE65CA2|nr:hypothetical protein [Stenotrophomonas sp. ISL-67]MBT2767704.1 hypothetical protein [Stenotrophomonas sp. ISL-67]
MAILLIRQPSPEPLPAPVELAGHAVHCQHCATLPALVQCLREARHTAPDWVLIEPADADPSQWAEHGHALCAALDALSAPYIEMAANDDGGLDAHLHPQHAPAATVVCSSGRADACRLSLAIAERRLLSAAGRA